MLGLISIIPITVFTIERPFWILIYLVIVAALIIGFARKDITRLLFQTKWSDAVLLLSVSLFMHALTVVVIKNFAIQPHWPFDSRNASFLLFNNYFIWTKPFDVFVQQLLIILFVLRLKKHSLSLRSITWIVFFLFGVLHLFQILRTDVLIGLLFTATAIVFSFVFPFTILKVRNGYIYNYMIHLAMYNIAALIAWFLY